LNQVNTIYNIERRGNIKDLNKASKNFNLPLASAHPEDGPQKKIKKAEFLNTLNLCQLKQLKTLIDGINNQQTEKHEEEKKAMKGNFDSVGSQYEIISANQYYSRNANIKNLNKDYNSENFSGVSWKSDENLSQQHHVDYISKPGIPSKFG